VSIPARLVHIPLLFALTAVVMSCTAAESPPAAQAPDRVADEAEIRAMVAKHESEVNARDFAAFSTSFAPEGDVIVQGSPKATGPQAIQAAMEAGWASAPADRRITLTVDQIRFVGNDAAIVDNTGRYSAADVPADRATAVLERRDGSWKIIALRIFPGPPM